MRSKNLGMCAKLGSLLILATSFIFSANVQAAKCGKFKGNITIADMPWKTASMLAHVDKRIFEAMGCKVELIAGDTVPTFTSMNEKGRPDIASEYWANAAISKYESAIESGRLHALNKAPISGIGETWWILPQVLDANPELINLSEIIKRPDLFPDKEDPKKGAFYGCPAGWSCQFTNINLAKAFGMQEKGWKIINPGSAAGLDGSIAKAAAQGKNWIGYYWTPTALVAKYDLRKVKFNTAWGGDKNWHDCIVKPVCVKPKKSHYSKSVVVTLTSNKFFKKAPKKLLNYLKKRSYVASDLNKELAWMEKNNAGGKEGAVHFLRKNKSWKKWVSKNIAISVEAGL